MPEPKRPIIGWSGTPGRQERARLAAKKSAKDKAFLKALDRQLERPKGT